MITSIKVNVFHANKVKFNIAECVVKKGAESPDCRRDRADVLAATNPLAALDGRVPRFSTVDMTDLICDGKSCSGAVGNTFVYLDSNHLSRTYISSMSSVFAERLLAATGWK